jgi:D-alanyl-D-alanine carboxypeptidase (penicillin-binding protein 5/6)
MEAIEQNKLALSDMVTASAHACSMGGSQIYLEEGEQMSVEDMLKSVVIASANDAAVALAEHIVGTEEAFVALMNKRAQELGMKNTHFENTNGLDDSVEDHVTSARDIAIMSAELISHKKILEYSSIWMDTIRNGKFGLTNTNRLVRFYKGANGLKTGSTSKARFCISATAERKGMTLICVVMAAPTRDIRNATATALLDWGFANFDLYTAPSIEIEPVKIAGGVKNSCTVENGTFKTVAEKSSISKIKYSVQLPQNISAPIRKGDKIGSVEYYLEDEQIGKSDIIASEDIDKISFSYLFFNFLSRIALK